MTAHFRGEIRGIPDQFALTPRITGSLPAGGRLLVAGMGGSAMAGEFLALGLPGRPTVLVRDEFLPADAAPGDQLLAISYSGDTSETLAVWREAKARGLARAAVASGGRLLREARDENLPHAIIGESLSPRNALGLLVRAAWGLAEGPVRDWARVAEHLRGLADRWCEGELFGPAGLLAGRLEDTLPVLLAAGPHAEVAARRWVADIAENAKSTAVVWELPEAGHNRLMALAREAPHRVPVSLVVLGIPKRAPARRRLETTLETIKAHGGAVEVLDEPHSDPWVEALGLAHLGDWVSLFLADRLGVDPASLSLMNDLKHRLRMREEAESP